MLLEMTVTENDNANKLFKRVQLSGKGGFGRVFFGEMAETHQPVRKFHFPEIFSIT